MCEISILFFSLFSVVAYELVECCTACIRERECCAISYNASSRQCIFSDYCLFSPDITQADTGWTIMTRIDGKGLFFVVV